MTWFGVSTPPPPIFDRWETDYKKIQGKKHVSSFYHIVDKKATIKFSYKANWYKNVSISTGPNNIVLFPFEFMNIVGVFYIVWYFISFGNWRVHKAWLNMRPVAVWVIRFVLCLVLCSLIRDCGRKFKVLLGNWRYLQKCERRFK